MPILERCGPCRCAHGGATLQAFPWLVFVPRAYKRSCGIKDGNILAVCKATAGGGSSHTLHVVKEKTHSVRAPRHWAGRWLAVGMKEKGRAFCENCEARAKPRRHTTSNAKGSDNALWSCLGKKGALPWPAPSSFSAHEMQLDFSKLLGKEPQKNYFTVKHQVLLLQFIVGGTPYLSSSLQCY